MKRTVTIHLPRFMFASPN